LASAISSALSSRVFEAMPKPQLILLKVCDGGDTIR